MSRPLVTLIALLVVVVGVLAFLASQAREVPQTRVEKPVAPEALAH